MKTVVFVMIGCFLSATVMAEPVCHKCEMIRAENAKKVNPYVYYEDYLKAQEGHKESPQPQPQQSQQKKPIS